MKKKIDLIGIQMDLGASTRGMDLGPYAIKKAGLFDRLEKMDITWQEEADIVPLKVGKTNPEMKNYQQIIEANTRLYQKVKNALEQDMMPITLGGDHSVATGSIPAVQEHFENIGVIWIDAHGDFNNPKSSDSGNMHGMSFSAVCGEGPAEMVPFMKKKIDPKKCVQIGARDLDGVERKRMREAGVTIFSMTEIDKIGLPEIIRRAVEIAGDGTAGIHISFDMDVITPEEAPGVGTPVHSGLSAREAFLAMEMLYESQRVISLDMVEVNPLLDVRNKTGFLACRLILSLLGETLY